MGQCSFGDSNVIYSQSMHTYYIVLWFNKMVCTQYYIMLLMYDIYSHEMTNWPV